MFNFRKYITIVEQMFRNLTEGEPYLVPAIKHNGKVYRGHVGDDHSIVAKANGLFGVGWKNRPDIITGFVNHQGHFLSRHHALNYALKHDLIHDRARQYLANDGVDAELGASFLKKPDHKMAA